jgi:hypothetical protein
MHIPSRWVDCLARFARIIGLLGLAAGLAACSTVKLAYNNIDEVAYWWLDSYVDFTDDQSGRVRAEIQRLHAWHRKAELPQWGAILNAMEQMAPGEITASQACAFEPQLRARIDAAADQAEPGMVAVASGLDAEQLKHLRRKFERVAGDFRKEWVDAETAAMKEKRLDRMASRSETVYGALDQRQREVLRSEIDKSIFDPRRVADEQRRRHQDLLAVLSQVAGQSLSNGEARKLLRGYLQRLQHSPDAGWRNYERAFFQETCGTLAALHNSTTAAQREVATRRLRGWQRDFRELAAQQ